MSKYIIDELYFARTLFKSGFTSVAVNLPEEYCLILDDFAKLIFLTTELCLQVKPTNGSRTWKKKTNCL